MARTTLPLSAFAGEATAGLADPAGTAVDQANGMIITGASLSTEVIPPTYDGYRGLMLRVANTAASPFNVIVRAGAYPPAMREFLGDLTVSVTNGTTKWIGPFDHARHAQADDSINVDFGVGFTGTITAFITPRNVG